jgi:uncharacterized FlgJ-related protein
LNREQAYDDIRKKRTDGQKAVVSNGAKALLEKRG